VRQQCFYVTYYMHTHSRRLDLTIERKIVKKGMEVALCLGKRVMRSTFCLACNYTHTHAHNSPGA